MKKEAVRKGIVLYDKFHGRYGRVLTGVSDEGLIHLGARGDFWEILVKFVRPLTAREKGESQ